MVPDLRSSLSILNHKTLFLHLLDRHSGSLDNPSDCYGVSVVENIFITFAYDSFSLKCLHYFSSFIHFKLCHVFLSSHPCLVLRCFPLWITLVIVLIPVPRMSSRSDTLVKQALIQTLLAASLLSSCRLAIRTARASHVPYSLTKIVLGQWYDSFHFYAASYTDSMSPFGNGPLLYPVAKFWTPLIL